jgi:hypothetical protein
MEPEVAPVLALHFKVAGEFKKALHYFELSGQRAEAMFAWQEAESHYQQMLGVLRLMEVPGSQKQQINLHCQVLGKLVQIHYLQGHLAERDADLRTLEDLASQSGEEELRLQAILLKAQQWNNEARYQDVIAVIEQGLNLAAPASAMRGRLLALNGLAYLMLGQPQQALE